VTAAIILAFVGLHGTLAWGRVAVFRIDGRKPAGVRVIEICAAISVVAGLALILLRDGPVMALDAVAWLCTGTSGALCAWGLNSIGRGHLTAAFSRDVPRSLVTTGP